MHREPEWDDYSRAEAIAAVEAERYRCRECGAHDAMVPIPGTERDVTWPDGRRFRVEQYRCLSCASREIIDRDLAIAEAKIEPTPGRYIASDGRRITATET